jgi:protein-S-isoprenylcysteine O-methyltransferase Ste14
VSGTGDSMAWAALAVYLVYLGSAFGLRSWLQHRATGSTGYHGISGRAGSAQWWGGVLFAVALVLGLAAPVAGLAGLADPVAPLDGTTGHVAGTALAVLGVALTLVAQRAMGRSWRIGVDPAETTELVTSGPFALVRNPVFAAMLPTSLGLVLMLPNPVALAGLAALWAALEIQTRVVEEPYLLRTHGAVYARYAARVGRFVPGVGRLAGPDVDQVPRRAHRPA